MINKCRIHAKRCQYANILAYLLFTYGREGEREISRTVDSDFFYD